MNDGWYRIVHPHQGSRVAFFYKNSSLFGSVPALTQEDCLLEPVHVLSEAELQELLRYRVEDASKTPPVSV